MDEVVRELRGNALVRGYSQLLRLPQEANLPVRYVSVGFSRSGAALPLIARPEYSWSLLLCRWGSFPEVYRTRYGRRRDTGRFSPQPNPVPSEPPPKRVGKAGHGRPRPWRRNRTSAWPCDPPLRPA